MPGAGCCAPPSADPPGHAGRRRSRGRPISPRPPGGSPPAIAVGVTVRHLPVVLDHPHAGPGRPGAAERCRGENSRLGRVHHAGARDGHVRRPRGGRVADPARTRARSGPFSTTSASAPAPRWTPAAIGGFVAAVVAVSQSARNTLTKYNLLSDAGGGQGDRAASRGWCGTAVDILRGLLLPWLAERPRRCSRSPWPGCAGC